MLGRARRPMIVDQGFQVREPSSPHWSVLWLWAPGGLNTGEFEIDIDGLSGCARCGGAEAGDRESVPGTPGKSVGVENQGATIVGKSLPRYGDAQRRGAELLLNSDIRRTHDLQ